MVQRSISSSLTPELTARVVAVALYGAGNGTLVKGPLKESTIANCARGDFVSVRTFPNDFLISRLAANSSSVGLSRCG